MTVLWVHSRAFLSNEMDADSLCVCVCVFFFLFS